MKAKDIAEGIKNGTIDPEAVICVEVIGGGYPVMKEATFTPTYNEYEEYEARDAGGRLVVRRGAVLYARS